MIFIDIEKACDTFLFIDVEKACDTIYREILWKTSEKKVVKVAYMEAIKKMYKDVVTCVQLSEG